MEDPSGVWEAAPAACAAFICFASFIGSTNGLEFEHHREVSPVSGEVMLSRRGDATFICPITGQHSLFLSSAIRIAIGHLAMHVPLFEERYGFTLFRWKDTIV